jgi:molybdopterin/thiamine biosynthesis adenylyltransferase
MKSRKHIERNRGFISDSEQEKLQRSTVGVAGAGGDGGRLAITLARMGVTHFKLADPEVFDLENLNRQEGSTHATIGKNKATVIAGLIKAINPAAEVVVFTEGITASNIDDFLEGVSIVADEMEFTQHWLAVMLARKCREKGIPVVMGLNVGFGCMVTSFTSRSYKIEEILGFSQELDIEQVKNTRVPLEKWVPRMPSYLDLNVMKAVAAGEISAPSVAPGVDLASGYTAVEVFNHLTGRKKPVLAPRVLWFDAMERRAGIIKLPALSYKVSLGRLVVRDRLGLNQRINLS